MKIGIITIQKSQLNYGACLQCYALFKRIKTDYGHCEVIDLLRPMLPGYVASSKFSGEMDRRKRYRIIINRIKYLIKRSHNQKLRDQRFAEFSKLIDYSKKYRSVNSLYKNPPVYDLYITGSDQVWNPNLPYINEPYFLTFVQKNKKISYASSFGIDAIPSELQSKYAEWLGEYSAISTRESSGAAIIKDITGKDVQVVLDPVFLLNKHEWQSLERPIEGVEPGSYVFFYMLHKDSDALEKASQVAKARNKRFLYSISQIGSMPSVYGEHIEQAGPAEWLWLIDHADTFVTTSFHGSAFGLIFGKPLVILMKKGVKTNTRIENLSKLFNISDHIYEVNKKDDFSNQDFLVDNNSIKSILEKEVAESLGYLKMAIHEKEN